MTFQNFLFSDIGKGRLTVGKIYGGLLILENWKASKFGNGPIHSVSYRLEKTWFQDYRTGHSSVIK